MPDLPLYVYWLAGIIVLPVAALVVARLVGWLLDLLELSTHPAYRQYRGQHPDDLSRYPMHVLKDMHTQAYPNSVARARIEGAMRIRRTRDLTEETA